MQQLEGRINNQITGVKGLTVRDDYAAEARDEHVTKLDNVLYIFIALVNIKTSYYLSEKKKIETKLEVKLKRCKKKKPKKQKKSLSFF